LLNICNLSHTVHFPTRIQNTLGTAIDNIFLDNSRLNSFIVSPIANGLLHHDAQYLILKHIYTEANITRLTHSTRFINNDTITIFQQLLKNETWKCIYVRDDINDIFNIFLNIFEGSFPVKFTNFNITKNGFITKGIMISCRHKRSYISLTEAVVTYDSKHIILDTVQF
jgi:hypothetical protein